MWFIAHLGSISNFKQCRTVLRIAAAYSIQRLSEKPVKMTSVKDLALPKPTIGVVQMTSTPDKVATFEQMSALVERAKLRGAQMVFVPEAADYISESREQAVELAEPIDGSTVGKYKVLAQKFGVWLSVGGFHEKLLDLKKVYNTHLVIDSSGDLRGIYRKVHLFDVDIPGMAPMRESDYVKAGAKIEPPVSTPVGMVGMAICYDMRFPELASILCNQGAEILTFPSAFTIPTGMAHWETILRCRAIENQCYVIAAAQIGRHTAKRSSYGHSMVVDPWGCVVAECHDKPDVCVVEIDLELLRRRRLEMPVMSHKRPDIYRAVDVPSSVDLDSQSEYNFGGHAVRNSSVFYRSALSVAFVNRKPVVPGHVLVIPIRLVERFSDLTPAEVSDVFATVQVVSKMIEKHHKASSLTIAIQDGPEAGQSVKHVHVHILPRKPGDFQNSDDVYEKLEKHDKNTEISQWRTDDDMAQEALILRNYFKL